MTFSLCLEQAELFNYHKQNTEAATSGFNWVNLHLFEDHLRIQLGI